MTLRVPLWINILIAITVAILLGKSYVILSSPLQSDALAMQLVELAGRNAAMLCASLLAILTQRRSWFSLLCIMGIVRESWDFANQVYFFGFRPGSLGLLAFVFVWGFALWTLRGSGRRDSA